MNAEATISANMSLFLEMLKGPVLGKTTNEEL